MKIKTAILLIIGSILLLLVCVGISYAVWVDSNYQEGVNIVNSDCFIINLISDNDSLQVENDFPIIDEDGMKREAYSFTVENTCETDANYKLMVELQSDNTLPSNLIKVALNDDISLLSDLEMSDANSFILELNGIKGGTSRRYDFRQWFDESGTLENSQNKRISTKIVFDAVATYIPPYTEPLLVGNDPVLNSGFVPVVIDDDGTVRKADIFFEWFNYEKKQWANAVTVNSDIYRDAEAGSVIPMSSIEEMYVWVPRYSYDPESIVDASHAIDITFVDTDSSSHSAFSVGDTELSGMWVGKFEMGFIDGENYNTPNVEYVIKPGLNSVNNSDVSTMFSKIASINNTNGLDSNTDVHMLKNTEWGGVAYLSQSIYGVCSSLTECEKVELNNYFNSASFDIVTGCGGNDTPVLSSSTGIMICPETNRWFTELGSRASTTRNVTGIYDMAGGRYEYVMGNMVDSTGKFYSVSGGFTFVPELKYYDVYSYSTTNSAYMRGIPGDATEEFKPSGSSNKNWNSDYSYYVFSSFPWFIRGGRAYNGANAGIWTFNKDSGGIRNYSGSRAAVWSYDV